MGTALHRVKLKSADVRNRATIASVLVRVMRFLLAVRIGLGFDSPSVLSLQSKTIPLERWHNMFTPKATDRWYDVVEAYASQDLFREMFPGCKPKVDTRTPSQVESDRNA